MFQGAQKSMTSISASEVQAAVPKAVKVTVWTPMPLSHASKVQGGPRTPLPDHSPWMSPEARTRDWPGHNVVSCTQAPRSSRVTVTEVLPTVPVPVSVAVAV